MNNKQSGFTLAEVLVTLVVIGAIAALTIPSLFSNLQDTQIKNAWKKFYSDFSQATIRGLTESGGSFKGVCAPDPNAHCLRNIYMNYLSYVRSCDYHNSYGNCWHYPAEMKWLNGNTLTDAEAVSELNNGPAFVMNSGIYVMIYTWADSCNAGNQCGWLHVDVNGKKPPNKFGKDILGMRVFHNRVIPFGADDGRTCDTAGEGLGCAAEYLKQ